MKRNDWGGVRTRGAVVAASIFHNARCPARHKLSSSSPKTSSCTMDASCARHTHTCDARRHTTIAGPTAAKVRVFLHASAVMRPGNCTRLRLRLADGA